MTNVKGPVDATAWVDKSICNINDMKLCEYNNEEEFRTIILEAKRIFEQYGDEIFQELSISPKDISTPEMEKELYENRERLIKEGIRLLDIEGMIGLKRIHIIVEKIRELENKPFQMIISDLIMQVLGH